MAAPAWPPAVPAPWRALLDPRRGLLQPPVRAEIFGQLRFAEHGASLGLAHRAARASWRSAGFFPRVAGNIRVLREAHAFIGAEAADGHDISPAAEWLLDNFHLVEAQLVEIHESMPRSYFRALPVLEDAPLAGLPRVYGIAWAFVAHTDAAFDEELLVHFLDAYQQTRELGLGEVWALPTTLRVLLIENLRRLAEREAAHQAARALANACCDAIESATPEALDGLLAQLQQRGVAPVFLAQMAQRLRDPAALPHAHVDTWLHHALPDPPAAQTQQIADQTADNLSVSNVVGSLRAIGDADWTDIVARCSPLIRLMLCSPVFEAEYATTRDTTLHDIERLARASGRSELEVARAVLALIAQGHGAVAVAATPGHWLAGGGRPALASALGMGAPRVALAAFAWRRWALPAYLGGLLLSTAAVVAWVMAHHALPGGAGWGMAAALLLALPVSEAVLAVMQRVASETARPRAMPRLGLPGGLGREHRVLVAVPAMLSGAEAIATLAHRLLLHHLANPERETQIALLSDFLDADTAETAADAPLLACALQHIDALNARLPAELGAAPRFLLLHRVRRFSQTEGRWIGWERKRGKLEALIGALAGGNAGAFVDLGERSRLAEGTRYLLTLDSDTVLPPGRLRELIGIAAHPLNRPQVDPARRVVTAGYGILQPRVQTPLPAPARSTPFHWLFAGPFGIDPYGAASSEIYQDLFGEGSFAGKGLLDVAAVHTVLGGRLPDERVLSHDLLEGAFARCAGVSELALIEDAPYEPDVAAARVHRWTRGDWQLLPFLLAPRRWPIGGLNRWKLADNLRRSLVAPATLLLLLAALAGRGIEPWAALMLLLAAAAAGPLIGALVAFVPRRDDLALRHFLQKAALELARALGAAAWALVQWLPQALQAGDAIVRTLHRLLVSRRHLLQWMPSAAVEASQSNTLAAVWRRHRATPIVAGTLLLALPFLPSPAPALAVVLIVLWAASPALLWWAGRPFRPPVATLAPRDRGHLLGIARDTWRYFERTVTALDHHLPPDNLQTAPHEMLAHRTSPTNIGLYLLAVACARRFEWITRAQMLARLEATLATLALLARHRGHFLNWYDTQTLAPLLPAVVSTVDSGNLCGHLLAVAQACAEQAASDAETEEGQRLLAVARACTVLAWQPQWGFLYHRKRHLLHIGFRVAEQQLDAGFYDLLASESRLTSLIAIAKGDVPVRHWAALGRPFYAAGATAGLRSWSGSMFEYLMPSLVLEEPHGSLLREACLAAVDEQVAYGAAHGVPWGMSESAYAASDHTLAYQYAPQGVPRLALRRTPHDELVVAPYATALAAQVAPRRANANFAVLETLSARAGFGFIEALDYTPARQSGSARFTPVSTYMAHHQGMTIVALANVLLDGAARRWGMADPHIEAMGSLLHERAPRAVSTLREPPAAAPSTLRSRRTPGLQRELRPGHSAVEPTQLLSNGRYHVALRTNGAGSSRWGTVGLTRWRDDALRDHAGHFLWLRRHPLAAPVSITRHPAGEAGTRHEAVFHADRVMLDSISSTLRTRLTVWVSPEDDIEFRQVEVTNTGEHEIEIELMSAFEPTLADARADEAHPAFSQFFVRAGWQATQQALLFERTPRLETERHLHLAHFVASHEARIVRRGLQTDRQRWRGRNRGPGQPLAAFEPLPDANAEPGTLTTGLDPVAALSLHLRIAPGAKARITFATAASDDRGRLHAIIDKYLQPSHVERASLMSATLAGIRARTLRLGADDFAALQTLATALAFTLARPKLAATRRVDNAASVCDRRLLWRFGISGDRPIIGVSAATIQGLGLLRTLAQALRLWAWNGIACDIVIVNAEPASYQMPLQRALATLREMPVGDTARGPETATLHVLRSEDLSADAWSTLRTLARVWLQADGRSLPHHVTAWSRLHEQAVVERRVPDRAVLPAATTAAAPVPVGRFDTASGAFAFEVGPASRPARPWVNVLANPGFGTLVSEAGGGCTWARNSRLNQITAWSNDPVADPAPESVWLQDQRTRECWSIAPGHAGAEGQAYRVTHAPGRTTIEHRHGELEVSATWCVDAESAVKQLRLRLVNGGRARLALRIVGTVEWMMGAALTDRATVFTQALPNALLCTQRERGGGFGGGTAFLALAGAPLEDWTCDRREGFDSHGRAVLPERLGRRCGSGLDPWAAIATERTLAGGESADVVFLLGHADDVDGAAALATSALAVPAARRLERSRDHWDRLLGATAVRTPDPLFDVMVNRWLLYQAVACRLWAKAGFYQAGGATGFRDQLQDTMALAWAAPHLLREQILLCASRQFVEGDVQHWWHAPGGAGVRTHFSDDLLWLVEACVHYQRCTGDATLLDEPVRFLEGPPIPEGAEDLYGVPGVSEAGATVYEHAARTLDRSLRVGQHGLPLVGSGDWNDGMNRVGHGGRGESVWLAWFLCRLVAAFAPVALARGESERAARWQQGAAGWATALAGPAWDGAWYRRAFFDDGSPLGAQGNTEARIDLIAQAWAVLSNAAPVGRQRQAMAAAEVHLADADAGLLRLLDPPLAHATPSAGYIQAYPPGVRENGGQYAHAGVWALMADAALASRDGAASDTPYRDFTWLSPAHRSAHPVHGAAYGLEPFAMAGDVYSQPPYTGRGGWSWYTGAAAWLHRAAVESIFGLRLEAEVLRFDPCLPADWNEAEITLQREGQRLHFVLLRDGAGGRSPVGARRLRPGETLHWRALPDGTRFVVPLAPALPYAAAA